MLILDGVDEGERRTGVKLPDLSENRENSGGACGVRVILIGEIGVEGYGVGGDEKGFAGTSSGRIREEAKEESGGEEAEDRLSQRRHRRPAAEERREKRGEIMILGRDSFLILGLEACDHVSSVSYIPTDYLFYIERGLSFLTFTRISFSNQINN